MQCLHCGKKLSLLRKISDGRFCSDAHREEYERLEGDIALARLLGARGARSGAPQEKPAKAKAAAPGSILPLAPLLPESLRAANWRRVACPPLRLLALRFAQSIPESCLRPAVRGFPQALPAELGLPVNRPCRAAVAPHPVPSFGEAQAGGRLAGPSVSSSLPEDGLERPPAMAGLAPLPLPLASVVLPPACHPRPALMGRRKLVVIVPRPHRQLRPAGLAPAGLLRLEVSPVAARPPLEPAGASGLRPLWRREALAKPSLQARGRRLKDQQAAGAAPDSLPVAKDPPLCGCLAPAYGCAPLEGGRSAASAGAQSLLPVSSPLLPSRPSCAALPQLRTAELHALATGPCPGVEPGLHRSAPPGWHQPEHAPELPAAGLGVQRRSGGWPAVAGHLPVEMRGASREPVHVQSLPVPLPVHPAGAFFPARRADLPLRTLRLSRRLAPIDTAAVPAPVPIPALARPLPDWNMLRAALPGSQLELIPPDPPSDRKAACTPDMAVSLASLEAAVSTAAAVQAPPPVEEPDSRDEFEAPRPARRVPEKPIRPVAQPLAERTPALPSTAAACWASLDDPKPMIPRLRLELDHADGSGPRRKGEANRKARKARSAPGSAGTRHFWSHAPSDLKWIAVVLPLLLVVVVYSFRAKTPNHLPEGGEMTATATAPAASAPQEGRLNALQRIILRRAAVRLFDDFRGGLGSWEGREGWAKTWRYGDATFIEPGELALLTPSLSMTDYTLTFLGQIERRSLNWVFRAKDLANYYSMRIVITRGGPLPEAAVVRSVVINGREQEVRTMPIPFPVRADTLYLVRMEVRGQDFTTYIQNQVVDHFSDSRLKRGGVGFYSPKGDRALLRWVEVSHQYDYLGRLCALLAPYGVQNFTSN